MVFKVAQIAALLLLIAGPVSARTEHYSSDSDRPVVFLDAIERFHGARHDTCEAGRRRVRAGIITHHFLANALMVEFFECLASSAAPDRIILIGPDHFEKGLRSVSVTPLPWETPFGRLDPDPDSAEAISQSLGLADDPEAFSGEHSVGVLIPFIKFYFPKAKTVPVIIQRNVEPGRMVRLKKLIAEFLDDPKTLVLLSMDFSHHHTSDEADRHDELARSVIEHLDFKKTDELDIDCHPGLKVLLAALAERKGTKVQFLNHTNSARLSGNPGQKNTTSYFTIIFYDRPADPFPH